MSYLKIEYWNTTDLGDVLYQDGYKNRLYLDVEVERPDYNTTIESDLNGDNEELPRFKKWEKVYKFECWMQEDLLDAFTFMQLHDNIEITLQTGDTIYVDQLRVEYEWEEAGCLADVTVSFTEDYVVAGTCNENMNKDCLCEDYSTLTGIIEDSDAKYTDPVGEGVVNGTDYLVWSNSTSQKYEGVCYIYNDQQGGWVDLQYNSLGKCIQDAVSGNYFTFDGDYWQLMPGYIISLTSPGANIIHLHGWCPDGTFATVYYTVGATTYNGGTFTSDEIIAGVDIDMGAYATSDWYLYVWNHSCIYGNSEELNFPWA